jgi:aspartate-semialdehyde dehydrogenase
MKSEVPLVVPEINASAITKDTKIIANPNCSTIQMVMALAPLHWKYNAQRVIVSTYQSVSGTGVEAVRQLHDETAGRETTKVYPHQIHLNLFPHGGNFNADGYTTEEQKLVDETRKILASPEMRITSTVVRVPVIGGHSEAVNVEFERDFELSDVRKLLSEFPGVEVMDDPENNVYPMPLHSENKNETFVGRIRRDFSNPNSLNLWIVADNLRKGAATNAVQIMNYLVEQKLI